MKVFAMIGAELRRLTSTKMSILALVALMIVPVVYGGLYLWANQDPYGKFTDVPVALVNLDEGVPADGDTKASNYGADVAQKLLDGKAFDWQMLSADAAATALHNGVVDFTVTLPKDFSDALTSPSGDSPRQATLALETNDANNYLASSIGSQAVEKIRRSVAELVGKEGTVRLLTALSDVREKLSEAADGAGRLATGTTDAETGSASLVSGTGALAKGTATLATGAHKAAGGASQLHTGARSLLSGSQSLTAGAQSLASGAQSLTTGARSLTTGAASVTDGSKKVVAGAGQVSAGTATVAGYANRAGAASQKVATELHSACARIAAALTAQGLTPAQVDRVLALLDPAANVALDANTRVQAAVGQLDALADGAKAVSAGAQQVSAGSAKVTSGAENLTAGAQKLTGGATSLAAGAKTLTAGASTLTAGAGSLASGTASLATGADSASDGAAKVSAGSTKLNEGITKLVAGATDLHNALAKGVTAIPESTKDTRDAQAGTLSNPVKVTSNSQSAAGDYGAGLAPFFVALAGWIGIYALFLIVKPISKRAVTALRSPIRVTVAGWWTPALLGSVGMLVLYGVLSITLGFGFANPLGTIGIMVLASFTYAAIILALNVWLGSVGQFIGLVLMVLQLVTAGGTFPWQTLPGPLAALHHILPMGYVVDAMRQLMYGGDMGRVATDVTVLLTWMLGALVLAVIGVTRMTHTRTLRDLQPSLIG